MISDEIRTEPGPVVADPPGASAGINLGPGTHDDGWSPPPPVRLPDGTRVVLHKDGEALADGLARIRGARRRICVETYILADDSTGNAYCQALCDKARAGVHVFLVYDSFGSHGFQHLWRDTPAMYGHMKRAGVRMHEFHPVRPWEGRFSWRPVNRDHRKLMVVDNDYALLGGLNIGREYAGPWIIRDHSGETWRDTAISVRGPGARMFQHAFARTWSYCHHGGRIARSAYEHGLPPHDGPLGVLASVPTRKSRLRFLLYHLFASARSSIHMTMAYFAPDERLVRELIGAAKRGVRVRLMLPSRSDLKVLVWAAQSFYDRLMEAGIEVYERQGAILHAKTMVIDAQTSIVGSVNLDERSIEYNLELSAIVQSQAFGKQMVELFDNDVRYAKRICPEDWRQRPRGDRFVQSLVISGRLLL